MNAPFNTSPERAHALLQRVRELSARVNKVFDESKHPRHPAGSSEGGEFAGVYSDAEVADAIARYTNYGFGVNSHLREGLGLPPSVRETVQKLRQAFRDPRFYRTADGDTIVYRGVYSRAVREQLEAAVGGTIRDRGFISVTTLPHIAEGVADPSGNHGVLLKITLPKGTRYLVGHAEEGEYILDSASKLRIDSAKPVATADGGFLSVEATYQIPKRQLAKAFDESKHPRAPAGTENGGQWVSEFPTELDKEDRVALLRRAEQSTMLVTNGAGEDDPFDEWLGSYDEINESLRASGEAMDWAYGRNQSAIRRMDRLFADHAYTLEQPTLAFRGISNGHIFDNLVPGTVVTDHGFVSTALNSRVGEQFAGPTSGPGARMRILLPKGTQVLSPSVSESELLLGRGAKFEYLGRTGDTFDFRYQGSTKQAIKKTFDPNQPRDEDGKWTDTGRSLPKVGFDPQHTSPDVQARFEALMERVPQHVLDEANVSSFYLGDTQEGVGEAMENHLNAAGLADEALESRTAAGVFDRDSRSLFASLFAPGALSEDGEVLYHELGHALEGRISSPQWKNVYAMEHHVDGTLPTPLALDEGFAQAFAEYQLSKKDKLLAEELEVRTPETQKMFRGWGF